MISDVSVPQEELERAKQAGVRGDTSLPEAGCPGTYSNHSRRGTGKLKTFPDVGLFTVLK